MTDATIRANAPQMLSSAQNYHFIAWRWHFYAGLYVIPFLTMLAVTGLVMLWISCIAGIGAERMAVTPAAASLPVEALQDAAEASIPGGSASLYIEPLAADRAAVFNIASPEGPATGVAVDPYSGEVLHSFPWRAGWYDLANEIHGTLLLGVTGDRMIEIAASLGLIMVATGLYLHWPRRGAGWRGALWPSLSQRRRNLWKSLHGVVGFWMSGVLVLFLISGLSWSGIWGARVVQAWATFPAEKWDNVPLSEDDIHANMNHGAAKEVPWGLEQVPMPESGSLAGQPAIDGPVTLNGAAEFARSLGFVGRFQIKFPSSESGVWTISHDSMSNDGPDPSADRTLHIDQFTGRVLADVGYDDYGPYAKAMAWGVAFHEGDLGIWNLVLNTFFCLSIIGLSVSGIVMWWLRRPARASRLAAPPKPANLPIWKGAALLVIVLGLVFPLGGLAIAAVLLMDATVLKMLPGLRGALS